MVTVMMSNIKADLPPLPLFFGHSLSADKGESTQSSLDQALDLNEHLIKNPSTTICLRAASDALKASGVHTGDLLIVDRSLIPNSGDIVIAEIGGELSVRRFQKQGRTITLSTDYSHIEATHPSTLIDFTIWGVVTSIVHTLI